jgi:aryl-alcohol dehydrogenase-like predicted oxidoreductase
MQYANLGRTGLKVSRLGLGTMNFGYVSDKKASFEILDAALDAGINFIDTADVYGGPQKPDIEKGYGHSEEIIGRWMQERQARDQIVLATKLYQPMGYGPNDRRLSAYHIRKACEDSLRRLKTDRIDLYQMHHIDRYTPWEEIWQAFELLVQQGKVLYVGSSNFAAWHIAMAQGAANSRHFLGLVSEQSLYNLANRTIELEVVPACRHLGVGVIPWSPLAGGLLAGALDKAAQGRRDVLGDTIERHRPQLEAYEALCRELGEQPSDVALAWLLHNPAVTAPIIGPRTKEQLAANLRAIDIPLSAEVLRRLDEIWPGPGGEAPEAYAW